MSQISHPGTWASTSRTGGALAGGPTGHYYGTVYYHGTVHPSTLDGAKDKFIFF